MDEAHRPEAGMRAGVAALAQMGLDDGQQDVQRGADRPRLFSGRATTFSLYSVMASRPLLTVILVVISQQGTPPPSSACAEHQKAP